MPDDDEVGAISPLAPPPMDFFGNCGRNAVTPTQPMHGTGPSRKLSNIRYLRPTMVLPILVGTSGDVAQRTHIPEHARSAFKKSFGLRLLQQGECFVRVAFNCQINWISHASAAGARLGS
jgi:hypothetical protein